MAGKHSKDNKDISKEKKIAKKETGKEIKEDKIKTEENIKENVKTNKKESNKKGKKQNKKAKKIIRTILIIILIACIAYICYYFISGLREKNAYKDLLKNTKIDESQVTPEKTERMLKVGELQKQNNQIVAWLEIPGTDMSYPVLQASDNSFYLNHNYKKDKAATGSLFLDKDFDMANGSSNYLIYGHRNKHGLMLEHLMDYANEDFYKNHKTIQFTTYEEDATYDIMAVFYSRVYYKNEQNVFRYYYFVNAKNEDEYNDYVNNAKKASIYDTEVTAQYGDQLLTLSTCEYSQEDGRFVVVARKHKKEEDNN